MKIVPKDLDFALIEATNLLKENDPSIPAPVQDILAFLSEKQLGFVISRNPHVGSCRDASSHRYRLGHRGIPLCDELKSLVTHCRDNQGNERVITIHCRGHLEFDLEKCISVADVAGSIKVMEEEKLKSYFGLEYGSVNPILLDIRKGKFSVTHIFDESVFSTLVEHPGTMMTNCGSHTWGIEFDPVELFRVMPNSIRADISNSGAYTNHTGLTLRKEPRSIGIVTGNGPESGMAIWEQVNDSIAEILKHQFTGDLSLPKVYVASMPGMGLSMELIRRESMTWKILSDAVEQVCKQGVQLLCLPCHTTHYFTPEIRKICKAYGVTFISMAEVVIDYIRRENIREFAMLGISYPASLGEWSAYSKLAEYSVEKLKPETLNQFLEIGYMVKKKAPKEKIFQKLVGLLNKEIESQNVVVAMTELSVVLQGQKKQRSTRRIIDALQIYAEAVAKASLGLPWQGSRLEYTSH